MLIKSETGKYEIKVDKTRRIVYETFNGLISSEEYMCLDQDYRTKVMPYLGKGPWMKFCDARKYIPNTSNNPEVIKKHMEWVTENGLKGGAMLVSSATLKMQLGRATKETAQATYFDDEKKADEWLRTQGF